MKNIRLFATFYFALQGVAVLAWWTLLFLLPGSRKYFQMGESETILLAFWLSDLFLLGVGSLCVSVFWQLICRQLAEEDLRQKFGADFEKYRQNLRCWIPRMSRFNL